MNPFFGSWPKWTPAFLESCSRNADIEWLFLGDHSFHWEKPPNVRFLPMTLPELMERAKEATGFNIKKESYSQVDLRPAFGKIFADYAKGYDFWGHCDVDVLWGRLRRFVTAEILGEYSIFSSRKRATSGHFTLYRNTPSVNDLFLGVAECREKLESPICISFDESSISRHIRKLQAEGRLPFRVFWESELVVDRMELRRRPHGWAWKDGQILDAEGAERMYLHFGEWKHTFRAVEVEAKQGPFHVARFGIFREPLSRFRYWKYSLEKAFCKAQLRW